LTIDDFSALALTICPKSLAIDASTTNVVFGISFDPSANNLAAADPFDVAYVTLLVLVTGPTLPAVILA
jgi:hypothetical protein